MHKNHSRSELFLDILMMLLIGINLSWIFFDALFESTSFKELVDWVSPYFYEHYLIVHDDFLKYDLIFISIYLTEFFGRWCVSLYEKTYPRWFLFPFYHWYDLLGCIPVGSFHLLRIFRLVIILRKLNELKFIQFENYFIYNLYKKYLAIATEEVSDRVVVQVLDGMSKELQQGTPILHQIVNHALLPQQHKLSEILSLSLTNVIHEAYDLRRTTIQNAISKLVHQAASKSAHLSQLQAIPLIGSQASQLLEETVSDMVFEITDQIVEYLRSDLSTDVIEDALEVSLSSLAEPDSEANALVQQVLLDTIEVVKAQVQIQQWKSDYDPNSPALTD